MIIQTNRQANRHLPARLPVPAHKPHEAWISDISPSRHPASALPARRPHKHWAGSRHDPAPKGAMCLPAQAPHRRALFSTKKKKGEV